MSEDKVTTGVIPDEVYSFIDDPKRLEEVDALIENHHLSDMRETGEVLDPLLNLVVAGKLNPTDIPARFVEKLQLSPEKAEALAMDFAKTLLVPIRAWMPSVDQALMAWGITDTTSDSSATHAVQQVSANAFVHDEIEKYHLELPDKNVQKKFERTLAEFVAKTHTREETLDVMTRPRKVGGLDLDGNASEKLLDGLSEDAKHLPPQPLPPTPAPGPAPIPKPLPPRTRITFDEKLPPVSNPAPGPRPPAPPSFDATTIHPDDEAEVDAHKEKIPSTTPLHDIDSATDVAINMMKGAGALDDEGKKKLRTIVKTRLKGIRDAYQTRSALESSEGLAWSDGPLSEALEVIEKVYAQLENEGVLKTEKEKQAYLEKRIARFEEKGLGDGETDLDSVAQDTSDHALQRSMSPAPSAGRPRQEDGGPSRPGLRELPAATESKSVSPLPLLKKKEKMRDVTAPRKLSGPVEELSSMTIADFRRLGGTGSEAAEEIKERIGLLEEESYGRRLAGLSAWRKSPLYQAYVSVVSEAMQGAQPIATVLRTHKASGVEMLSEEEVRALIKLNGTLRV